MTTTEKLTRLLEIEGRATKAPWGTVIMTPEKACDPPAYGVLFGPSMVQLDRSEAICAADASVTVHSRNSLRPLVEALMVAMDALKTADHSPKFYSSESSTNEALAKIEQILSKLP